MKSTYALSLIAGAQLLGLAAAQPHGHQLAHQKRADKIITATIWETVQAPDVIILVDENGHTIQGGAPVAAPTPAPAPVTPYPLAPAAAPAVPSPAPAPPAVQAPPPAPAPAPPAAPAPAPVPAPAPAPAPAAPAPAPPAVQAPPAPPAVQVPPAPPAPAPAAPAPAPAPAPPADSNANAGAGDDGFIDSTPSTFGISWSGYKGDEANSACKTAEDAEREWSQLAAYGTVRVYGTDCDQPINAMNMAKKYNKKVFMGVYWLDGRLPDQVNAIIDAVKKSGAGWGTIDTISVGNEDVHRGEQTPESIFKYVAQAKGMLRTAGYHGPVVHVDSQEAILANPGLCSHQAGDYIAANVHPFFNSQTAADQAGDFIQSQIDLLQQCGAANHKRRRNVRVRVTETGWPKDGIANGIAVPSKENQNAALASIRKKFSNNIIMFSAFNNYWMHNDASTFNTEHYWGMLDN